MIRTTGRMKEEKNPHYSNEAFYIGATFFRHGIPMVINVNLSHNEI